jgi:hypothetical protein
MRVNVTVAFRTHSCGIGRNGIEPSVVVHVPERADAPLGAFFLEAVLPQLTPQEIAERLRTILITLHPLSDTKRI